MSINAHPELPEFDYVLPSSLQEASRFLLEHAGQARPFLGGTDVFVRLRDGVWRDRFLVDVKHLGDGEHSPGGGEQSPSSTSPPPGGGSHHPLIHYDPLAGLTIPAAASMNQVIASPIVNQLYPILCQACRTVASYQLRTRATIVGNICNASPAGDTIGACLLLGTRLLVHGTTGFREEPLDGFFLAPGKTRLQPGDIVTALRIPPPPPGAAGTYLKLGRNNWGDLAIAGVTVYAYPDQALPSGYRFQLALASVAPVPMVVPQVSQHLSDEPPSLKTFHDAALIAYQACDPIDDVRGSRRYRQAMVRQLSQQAFLDVWSKLKPAHD